jgi:hypothetical protein
MAVKIIIIIFIHLVGDFLLQGNFLSKLKESKFLYLLLHVFIYSAFLFVMSPIFLSLSWSESLLFTAINGGLHFVIDLITSKLKHLFWKKNEGAYIAIISIDNLLHVGLLLYSYFIYFPEAAKIITGA